MHLQLSVIICTHNPRRDYLEKVLTALQFQSLDPELWELLVIDNASETNLSSEINLNWHPQSRHIREEKLGSAHARFRGIKEANAELLLFVDDDNVLDSDYLKEALRISKEFSFLGVWGGQVVPEFDQPPPEWTKPYWNLLAINEFTQARWSNLVDAGTHPCGAGMCFRKVVADTYIDLVLGNLRRLELGRKGTILSGCEDTDLAFTACDIGLGMGQFPSLKLTHLIPPNRVQEPYLLKIQEASSYSVVMLHSFWGKIPPIRDRSLVEQIYEFGRTLRMSPIQRKFHQAAKRGIEAAIKEIKTHQAVDG